MSTAVSYPNVFFVYTRTTSAGKVRYPGFLTEAERGALPHRVAGRPLPPGFREWAFFSKGPGTEGGRIWNPHTWEQVQALPEVAGDLVAELNALAARPNRYRVRGAFGQVHGEAPTKGEAAQLLQRHVREWRDRLHRVGHYQTGYTATKRRDGGYDLKLRAVRQFTAYVEEIPNR